TFNPPRSAPRSTILIRLMAGGVFLSEGILKFVYINQGVGRFTKIGIPAPGPTAHFVAVLEIVGGLLIMSGLLTRLIAVPFEFFIQKSPLGVDAGLRALGDGSAQPMRASMTKVANLLPGRPICA